MIARKLFDKPLTPAEKQKRHRERKAERERHTAELIALLYNAVPPELAERLDADERYKDIIREALLR